MSRYNGSFAQRLHTTEQVLLTDRFHTSCPTCSSRLLVKDASLVGQILSCPKCGSMMMIEAPEGEQAPAAAAMLASGEQVEGSAELESPTEASPTDFVAPTSAAGSWLPIVFAGVGTLACVTAIGWYSWNSMRGPSRVEGATSRLPVPSVVMSEEVASTQPKEVPSKVPVQQVDQSQENEAELVSQEVDPFDEIARAEPLTFTTSTLPTQESQGLLPAPVTSDALVNLASLLGGSSKDTSLNDDSVIDELADPVVASSSNSSPQRDVRKNVERTLRAVHFKQVPLVDFLRTISRLANVPIQLDPAALIQTGNVATVPVSIDRQNAPAIEILRDILRPLGMQPHVSQQLIHVTTPRLRDIRITEATFDIGDLLSDGNEVDWGHFVATLVHPLSWTNADGPGTIELMGDRLKISNTRPVVIHVAIFLERLRVARSLPPQQKVPSHLTSIEPRWNRLGRKFSAPLNVNIWKESLLIDVVSKLEEVADVRILMDWESLSTRDIFPDTTAKLYIRDTTLDNAFKLLAGDRGLAIVPVDHKTVQLTTETKQNSSSYIEFYRFDRLNESAQATVEQLMLLGRSAIDPVSGIAIVVGPSTIHRTLLF